MSSTSSQDLATAVNEVAGSHFEAETFATVGPGLTYFLELPSGRIAYFNQPDDAFSPAFYKLLESSESWSDIVVEADRTGYLANSDPSDFQSQTEYRIRLNRRGETLPVRDYRRLLKNAIGEPVGIVGRLLDDSFRAMAFDSLIRRSWKEIATNMTRRYLHDFNNTIAGIYSLSELYCEPGSDPNSVAEAMGHIRDCSIRAQNITKKIRLLNTLENGPINLHDLGRLVEEQVPYMEALLPNYASISLDLPDTDLLVRLDQNLFRQVILHLTDNASYACGEEALVSVRLIESKISDNQPATTLEFRDNGTGFPKQYLDQPFTPFFTTKDKSTHTGLGLSIAADFAQKSGGSIEIENAEKGALVRITLPLASTEPEAPEAKKDPSTPASKEADTSAPKPKAKAEPFTLHIYTWEDISRHPLLAAMEEKGWKIVVHLEPGDLLISLVQPAVDSTGVLVFKNPLDERVEPLIFELGRARNCPPLALLALGESPELVPEAIKRNCGFVASGSSKPSALISKLTKFFGPLD